MKIFDISRTLVAGTAVWPGDTPYQVFEIMKLLKGDSVNLSTIKMSAHTGTHVDAPLHFTDSGPGISELDLRPFWGLAQVVTLDNEEGPLFPADFDGFDLTMAQRLLVKSPASQLSGSIFPPGFVYPSPELADYLGGLGIILYGTDAPSVDAVDSKMLDGHRALTQNQIIIMEWLNLSEVENGLYELVALPLKIAGGDGSPVRAALKTLV